MSDTSELWEQFIRLQWLLLRYHRHNRFHGPMGEPHRGQGRVLALLKLQPEISQKELSDILDIRAQSLGELLIKLERSGFIERMPSEIDRRGMVIRLTDAGRQAADENEKKRRESDTLFDCLSDHEQTVLLEYLGRIISSLEQKVGDPHKGQRSCPPFWDRGAEPPFHQPPDGCDHRRRPRFPERGDHQFNWRHAPGRFGPDSRDDEKDGPDGE